MKTSRLEGVEFAASDVRVTWINATETCELDNATLAITDTSAKRQFANEHFTDLSDW